MEDTFIDGWNSCREFVVKLLGREMEDWTQNGPPVAAVKTMQNLIVKEAVLGLQDGSYLLPSIRQREETTKQKESKNEREQSEFVRSESSITPTLGSGPQPTNSPIRMNIGQMTDEIRELVNQLTIADELDGSWATKWKEIQRKEKETRELVDQLTELREKGKDVGDSSQGSDIRS